MDAEAKYWRDKWLDAERQLTAYMELLRQKDFQTSGKKYIKRKVVKRAIQK